MCEVIQIRPSEETIHRTSRGFVTPKERSVKEPHEGPLLLGVVYGEK